MTINPKLCRAARAMLGHLQSDIQAVTGISKTQLSNYEAEKAGLSAGNLEKIKDYFESYGLEFIEDGIRERPTSIMHRLKGPQGFLVFMNDVYETVKEHGGDMCLFNTKPSLWIKHLGQAWYDMHNKRMGEIKNDLRIRIAIREGDESFILGRAEYRWFPKDKWTNRTYYAYGPKLAFLNFENNNIDIRVFNDAELADSFRIMYDVVWEHKTQPIENQ